MPTRTEEVASKVMGAVKEVKATFEGLHGVFRTLAVEHGEVGALLGRVKGNSDVDLRRQLFPTIRRELLSHEKGELRVVYPVFAQHPDLKDIARRHDAEASELEQMLASLDSMQYADESWGPTFEKLVEAVQRHVKEEEDEWFPAGMRVLGKEEAEQMLGRYEAAKREVAESIEGTPATLH